MIRYPHCPAVSALRTPPAIALMSALAFVLVVTVAAPARASHDVQPARVAGETRIDTAARIAALDFPSGAGTALLARADDFPDALAAAGLAGQIDAPVLLTHHDHVPERTNAALGDLRVVRVILLGGEGAISREVARELGERYDVSRIAGPTRFATAAAIARAIAQRGDMFGTIGTVHGRRAALIVNGNVFADALAAGSPAAVRPNPLPLLLTERDRLPSETAEVLRELEIEQAVVVGGPAAVSADVEAQLRGEGLEVMRVAGATRTETATAVADFSFDHLGYDPEVVILARGDAFPDALAAGPHAATRTAPVLLTASPDELSRATESWLARVCPHTSVIQAIGGRAAVSTATLEAAEGASESCHANDAETAQRYLVAPQQPQTRQAGEAVDFEVRAGVQGDEAFHEALDLVLFPCATSDVTGGHPDHFEDADNDGHADAFGATNSFNAAIAVVNGEDIPDTRVVRDAADPGDDMLTFRLFSAASDCTVVVVFHDADGDGQLDLDAEHHPVEPYGVGKARWQE